MPTHFHMQSQPWQFHNTVSSSHEEQQHSTMPSLTTQLAYHSKNVRQKQNLPQYTNHNVIIHLHWCFRHQGNILSINPTLLDAPAIGLSVLKKGFGLSSSPILHGQGAGHNVILFEAWLRMRFVPKQAVWREPSMWQPRPQGWSMLIAMQPLYNELCHAIGMCFTLGSPLRILNVHCTQLIKCSIILEQKWMYFVH